MTTRRGLLAKLGALCLKEGQSQQANPSFRIGRAVGGPFPKALCQFYTPARMLLLLVTYLILLTIMEQLCTQYMIALQHLQLMQTNSLRVAAFQCLANPLHLINCIVIQNLFLRAPMEDLGRTRLRRFLFSLVQNQSLIQAAGFYKLGQAKIFELVQTNQFSHFFPVDRHPKYYTIGHALPFADASTVLFQSKSRVLFSSTDHRFLFLWTEDPPELIVLTSHPRLTCLPLHQLNSRIQNTPFFYRQPRIGTRICARLTYFQDSYSTSIAA